MAEIRIELNYEAVGELLNSPEMVAICEEHAPTAAAIYGVDYDHSDVKQFQGRNRMLVFVDERRQGR